jgi:hypothetical protein
MALAIVGCVINKGTTDGAFTIAAVAVPCTVVEAAPKKRMRVVGTVRCTVTFTTGTASLDSVTPEAEPGNDTVTVSEAILPKPFIAAYVQGVRASLVVHVNDAPVENAALPLVFVLSKTLTAAAKAAASAAVCAI